MKAYGQCAGLTGLEVGAFLHCSEVPEARYFKGKRSILVPGSGGAQCKIRQALLVWPLMKMVGASGGVFAEGWLATEQSG